MTTPSPMSGPTDLYLTAGAHETPEHGLCLMEAVAHVRGVAHTSAPAWVARPLRTMGTTLNDGLPDGPRQRLVALVGDLAARDTADDGLDEARSYLALDWTVRTWCPTWLALSSDCAEVATAARDLDPIIDLESALDAESTIRRAGTVAQTALDARPPEPPTALGRVRAGRPAVSADWVAAQASQVAGASADAVRAAVWSVVPVGDWSQVGLVSTVSTARTAVRVVAWTSPSTAVDVATRTAVLLMEDVIELYGRMVRLVA